jgi:hypothetical protein
VEVALDLAPCPVGGLEDASARRADFGQLRLDDRVLAPRLLGRPADGDVEDRSVEPAPPVAGLLGLTAFEDPAHAAVAAPNPVLQLEGPAGIDGVHHRPFDVLAVVGVDDAGEGAYRGVDEVARRIARDRLDLVAQPLHRPVLVACAAVDGAGDVRDQRAQQRLIRPQTAGAQPRRHPRREHLRLEGNAHDVIGARLERLAQLGGRVERRTQDDVRGGQLVAPADGGRQCPTPARFRDQDLRDLIAQRRQRSGDVRDADDAYSGRRQHRPAFLAQRLEAEHHHARALACYVFQRPGWLAIGCSVLAQAAGSLDHAATASHPGHRTGARRARPPPERAIAPCWSPGRHRFRRNLRGYGGRGPRRPRAAPPRRGRPS